MEQGKNKEILCYFLEEFNKELRKISMVWKQGIVREDTWDNYQRVVVQIDKVLDSEKSLEEALFKKEISSFRKKHYNLAKFVKGKIKDRDNN